MTAEDGRFAWKLPPGDYGVTDSVSYLGTLVVDVESAPQQGVLFGKERVFGKLLAIRVEDEFDAEQARGVPPSTRPALMRRIERNRTTAYRSLP